MGVVSDEKVEHTHLYVTGWCQTARGEGENPSCRVQGYSPHQSESKSLRWDLTRGVAGCSPRSGGPELVGQAGAREGKNV